jgi:hypothetical protein
LKKSSTSKHIYKIIGDKFFIYEIIFNTKMNIEKINTSNQVNVINYVKIINYLIYFFLYVIIIIINNCTNVFLNNSQISFFQKKTKKI